MDNIYRKNPLNLITDRGNNDIDRLEDTSYCPVCNKKMHILTANDIPSYVCLTHNISFPVKDE